MLNKTCKPLALQMLEEIAVEAFVIREFKLDMEERMKNLLKRLWHEEEGQDLVEYALLLVLISLAAVAAMNTLASAISKAYGNASSNLT